VKLERWALPFVLSTVACGADYYDKAPPPLPTAAPRAGSTSDPPKRPAHVLGKPVPPDVEDAAWALMQRCESEGRACTELGKMQASNGWGARDDKRAAELFSRGCDQGDGAGCENLAEAYTHGRGVARDLARGRDLHEQGCRAQRAFSCARLGAYFAVGYGVPRDFARARRYLEPACEDGDSSSCELAKHVEGCQKGEKDACQQLDDLGARYQKESR
jgi:TPR repeat protein